MAGEFFVMEQLFRLGHEPALTLGNAKHIDVLLRTSEGSLRTVSVKAVQGGGKWPVGQEDFGNREDLVFVFLLYEDFANVATGPKVWVMPATHVQVRKRPWIDGHAIYYAHKTLVPADLSVYKDAWSNAA